MKIGTRRPEEARVFDSEEGYWPFHDDSGLPYGSFEVFWHNGGVVEDGPAEGEELLHAGWYWHACQPGCLPDGEPTGPFGSSRAAREDADEQWEGD